jgi:hypothetical protein
MQEGGGAEVEEGHRTESPLYVRRVYPIALSATVCVVVGRSVISICCPRSDYMIPPLKLTCNCARSGHKLQAECPFSDSERS